MLVVSTAEILDNREGVPSGICRAELHKPLFSIGERCAQGHLREARGCGCQQGRVHGQRHEMREAWTGV